VSRRRKIILGVIVVLVGGFLVLQILPVHVFQSLRIPGNPPVTAEIAWDSQATHDLARMACFDCHSNETVYPWYAQIAPVSWLVRRDINFGRMAMNFSEDEPDEYDLDDLEGHLYNDMPPRQYTLIHPEANLTDEQRDQLLAGFVATFTEASSDGMGHDMGNMDHGEAAEPEATEEAGD
jgi:hypothetical protein